MKKILLFTTVLTLCMACSGEDGMDGAMGVQGPQGEQGIAGTNGEDGANGEPGADGENGDQGETGSANVIYSDWILNNFPESPILASSTFFNIEVPELTDEVKNTGLILVYARRISAPENYTIQQLPITIYSTVNHHYDYDFFSSFNSNITIRLESIDDSPIGFPIYMEFRYIIVPGGIPSGSKSHIDFNKMNYEEIVAHFSIQE